MLLWVYYSAQIFLLGAEFTKTYAYRHGSRMAHARPAGKQAAPQQSARAANDDDTRGDRVRDAAPPHHLVPMDRGIPPAARVGGVRGLANFRIAAAIAAAVGLIAGEILNAMRQRRVARTGRRA